MKILSIRLKNLASLSGEHFIDFESEPLASAGLVAIVGKTGAGKSTILDAMCLALFNRIPRLKDSDGKLQDVDGSDLLANSPLTVLRRGTAHGFAELCFVAQDQKHYLARWELKRSREKADGKLQSVQRYLKCLTDGVVIADKAKAVDANINKITQLSFDQFTRAVLLAQSEVTAFLKARDNERGELLEYLTNSNIFGKIGELAFRKTADIAKQRKQLEDVLGHIDILSDENVAELHQKFNTADDDYKKLDTKKIQFTQQQQWFERKQKLDDEIVQKQLSYDAQLKQHQNLKTERDHLKKLEVFAEIRPVAFQLQNIEKSQLQLTPKIQSTQLHFDGLSKQFDTEKVQFLDAERALTTIQNFESQHQQAIKDVRESVQERIFILDEFKKMKARCTELEQLQKPLQDEKQQLEVQIEQVLQQQLVLIQQLNQSQHFIALDQGLNAHIQQLQQFIQHYQNIESNLRNIPQAQIKLAQHKVDLEKLITQFGALEQIEIQQNQLRQNREQRISQLNKLEFIQQKLKQYFELQHDLNRLNQQLSNSNHQQQQLEQSLKQAKLDFQTAKSERTQLQHILQQQRLLHAENIEYLRAELKDGEPCIVCGSTSHPYRDDESVLSKALFELQQQQEQQAELKEQKTFKIWQDTQQKFIKLNAEFEQIKTNISQVITKALAFKNELLLQVSDSQFTTLKLNLDQTQSEIEMQLHTFHEQSKQDLNHLNLLIQQLIQTNKDQQMLNQQIQHSEHLLTTAQQLQQQIQHIVNCLAESEQQAWHQQTIQSAQQTMQVLKQRAQQREQADRCHQQLEQLKQSLQLLQSKQDSFAQQVLDADVAMTEKTVQGQQNNEKASVLIRAMTGLTSTDLKSDADLKPNEWLIQHDQQRQQLQNRYSDIRQQFEQLRTHFEAQKNELEQLKAQFQNNQQSQNQHQTELRQWLQTHTEFTHADIAELIQISPAQEQQIRLNLQTVERLFNEASSALKTMQEQHTVHLTSQPDIELSALLNAIQQNLQDLKVQQDVRDQLKLKIELHQQNLAKQKQFADQIQTIQQEEHRWDKISGLMGDATGKKFRDYAQQYNLDILIEHSNQQLAMLSQRYTLKRLENSLSLAIIDHDMDGETRSVASLSGGESFLTALALSLAIANMASGSMKIESLFIDEGFGTLDASSLHMVMNALDQLQNQGRKVVLISHIQEMHERIPVQIQVRPLGAGASSIKVVS